MELKKQTMYFAIETLTVFSGCFVSCHLMKLVTGRLCVLAFPYQCRVCIHSCSLIFHVLIQNKLYHGRASNFSGFAFENVALDSVSCCGTWEILSSFPTTSWWDRKWPFATFSWKKIFTYEWWIQQTFTQKNLLNSSVFIFFSIGDMFCIERLNVELFCRLLFIFWLCTSFFFSSKIVLFSTIIKDPTYTDRLLSVMAVFCEHKCGTHLHLFDTFVQEHHEPCRWHYLLHSSSPWHFLDLCCISLMGVFVERLCSASIFTNAPSAFIHLENWFIW